MVLLIVLIAKRKWLTNMVEVIGLTGGIATGKSTVSSYLASQGYEIIDADKITHQVQAKGSTGLAAITAFFGKDILNDNGELNRKKLGAIVFSDSQKLTALTRIIDPYIRNEVNNRINNAKGDVIILDAPTLFENGYHFMCDKIVTVACNIDEQIKRVMNRDGLNKKAALQRINSQWSLDIKKKLSDETVDSSGSIMQTRAQVVKLFNNKD